MKLDKLVVAFQENKFAVKAEAIANRLNLPIDNNLYPRIFISEVGIALQASLKDAIYVDFIDYLNNRSFTKKDALIRACKPSPGMNIIDATAGWGRDALLLAKFGASVLMLERNPLMAILLEDGLERLNQSSYQLDLTLQQIDAMAYFDSLAFKDFPDLIYIDPMHPERKKSALVKKRMQWLQKLIGPDLDAKLLLETALHKARNKVVLKWPIKEPDILKPNSSLINKTVKFNIYTTFPSHQLHLKGNSTLS